MVIEKLASKKEELVFESWGACICSEGKETIVFSSSTIGLTQSNHILELFNRLENLKHGKRRRQDIWYWVVRNWAAKFVQSWITSWHLRQELKGRVEINFQKWATYFTSKPENMHIIWCERIQHVKKTPTSPQPSIFLPIFQRKRFEGLGSLGSGRCGAGLPGNSCQTKAAEVLQLPSASTSWLSSVSWYLKYYFPVYQCV